MEHQDYLALVAEIAVALAGFTGIVGAFKHRSSIWTPEDLGNLATLLRASISALFLSLLPYLLHLLTTDPEIAWRIAAATLALVMGSNIYRFLKGSGSKLEKLSEKTMHTAAYVMVLSNAIAALGFLPASNTFLVAVTYQLIVATFNFALLIGQPIGSDAKEES